MDARDIMVEQGQALVRGVVHAHMPDGFGSITRAERKRQRRRSAIEPKIGHLKSDHRMGRCFLARLAGDAINAVLAAAGSNLRKLLGLIRREAGRFVFAPTDAMVRLVLTMARWTKALTSTRRLNQHNYPAAA